MDEEELDSLLNARPFDSNDAIRAEAEAGRVARLAIALWGHTSDHVQRQLLAPHPEIPSGYDLADFQALDRWLKKMPSPGDPRYRWLSSSSTFRAFFSPVVVVIDAQRFTALEARREIVRRAILYLEGR